MANANGANNDKTTGRLVKHACRTLLKSAKKDALIIFGFTNADNVRVKNLKIDKNDIKISGETTFFCNLDITKSGKLRFEYAIDFIKGNG